MKHVGTREILSDRLLLRRQTISDAQEMFDCYAKDGEVTKYLTWNPHKSVNETLTLLKIWVEEYKSLDSYRWFITNRNTGALMGAIDVVAYHNNNPIIGYVLGRSYWNKGYMSEALSAVINYLFNTVGTKKILIAAEEENIASQKVILKNGFRFVNLERKYFKNKDEFKIIFNYELSKKQYLERKL